MSLAVTTEGYDSSAGDPASGTESGVIVETGTIDSSGRRVARSDRERAERLFREVGEKTSRRVISPQSFTRIWNELTAAGLLELPRARPSSIPAETPYLSYSDGRRTAVFVRPDDAFPTSPARDTPEKKRLRTAWQNCVRSFSRWYSQSGSAH